MLLDAKYFRTVQGFVNANSEAEYKSAAAKDSLAVQFRTSINYVENAKRNEEIQPMIITASEVKYKYNISCMPDDELYPGDIIEAFGEHLIVVNTRAMTNTYKIGTAWLCNVHFKFQNFTPEIIERWGVLDSGVYSTTLGSEDILSYMKRQFKIYLPSDPDTDKIFIDKRLAVGTMYDQNGNEILEAYTITGRTKHTKGAYGEGTHLLELSAKSSEQRGDRDNVELLICDYISPSDVENDHDDTLLKCEISGRNTIPLGGYRKYVGMFYDDSGNQVAVESPVWDADLPYGISISCDGDVCYVSVDDSEDLSGSCVVLTLADSSGRYNIARMELEVF